MGNELAKVNQRTAYLNCTGDLLKYFFKFAIALRLFLVEKSDFLAEFSRIIGHCDVTILLFFLKINFGDTLKSDAL